MTRLRVSDEVREAFGGLRIAVIVADGFAGRAPWPEVDAALSALETAAADGDTLPVAHGVPAGAFDLDAVDGDITVRFASGEEDFAPLGEPGTTEHPRPGEVIYTDAKSVLTRHWNHRDADRTKVTEASGRIVFLLETTEASAFGTAVDTAAADLAARLESRSGSVTTHILTPAALAAEL